MPELHFKSSLPLKEIEKDFKDMDFFPGIMEGLNETLAYSKGKAVAEDS